MRIFLTCRHAIACLAIVCWMNVSWVSDARADNLLPPKVNAASADAALSTLTVKGANFGTALPALSLGGYGNLQVLSHADTLITARLPPGVLPGSYLLTLSVNNKTNESWVALGGTGPPGPIGPAGPQGAIGLQGATGPTGAAGPAGPPGPSGALGLAGFSCPSGQSIVGFGGTGTPICAASAAGGGGAGTPTDADGDGIADAVDPCPASPNVFYNGGSYCPALIYDVTMGALDAGATVWFANVLVTAASGSVIEISIASTDPAYNNTVFDSYAHLTIDVGSLTVPPLGSRVNVAGTVLAGRAFVPSRIVVTSIP